MADGAEAPILEKPETAAASASAASPGPASTPGVVEASAPATASTPVVVEPKVEAPAADAIAAPEPTLLQKYDTEQAEKAAKAAAEKAALEAKASADATKPDDAATKAAAEAEAAKKAAEEAAKPPLEGEILAKDDKTPFDYKIPETIKLDEKGKAEVDALLNGFRADPAKGVQALVDYHAKALSNYDAAALKRQHDVWNGTREKWRNAVESDAELGGSGFQTTMGAVARMRDMAVSPKNRAEFESFLTVTGAGDHPAFIRMMKNFARFYDEPGLPPPNAQPTPGNGKPPGKRSLYDHPTSGR